MLKLKEFITPYGKLSAAMLLGLMLVGCGGGGAENILCEGECSSEDDPVDDPAVPTGTPAGIAAADKFSLSVSDFAPQNAFDTDGISVSFQVIVSDQFGNPVTDGTKVFFVSPESGQIEPECTLTGGGCSVNWISSDPRPADGRLSILAYMLVGSEAFGDKNGNSIYDSADLGEFTDLGEACLDENENGFCEESLNEFFVDSNENSVIDAGDGQWNGPCFSDIDSTAICNAQESVVISEAAVITLSTNTAIAVSRGDFPLDGATIDLNDLAVHSFTGFIISDKNGNALPTGTTIKFSKGPNLNAFDIIGEETVEVDDQAPTGPFGVSVVTNAVATPGLGVLLLVVTFPDGIELNIAQWKTDDSTVGPLPVIP